MALATVKPHRSTGSPPQTVMVDAEVIGDLHRAWTFRAGAHPAERTRRFGRRPGYAGPTAATVTCTVGWYSPAGHIGE